jgi:O-antigen ligase
LPRVWLLALGILVCLLGVVEPLLALALGGLALLIYTLVRGWPVSGFVVLLIAAQLPRFRLEVGSVSVRPEQVALLLVLALVAYQALVGSRGFRLDLPFMFAAAWCLVNIVAMILHAPDPGDSTRHVIRLGMMVASYLAAINLLDSSRQWWVAFRWLVGLAVLQVSFGLLALAIFPSGVNIGVMVANNLSVPQGTLEEGNMYGSHAAAWLVLFLSMYAAARAQGVPTRWWLAGIGLMLLGTATSMARGAWVALAAGVALFVILQQARPQRWLGRLGVIAVLSPLFLAAIAFVVRSLPATFPFVARLRTFGAAATDRTMSNRMADLSQAISDWTLHPVVGWGPGTFKQMYGERWGTEAWIANQSARTLQETGIVGLAAIWGFFGSVMAIGFSALRRPLDRWSRGAVLGLLVGFIVLLIAFQATDGTWLAYIWLHAGLLVSGARLLSRSEEGAIRPAA